MKVAKVSTICSGVRRGLFATVTAATASAWAAVPQDLALLMEKWTKLEKTATIAAVIDGPQEARYDTFPMSSLLTSELTRAQEHNPGEVGEIAFLELSVEGRKALMHALFPTDMKDLAFCSGFVQKPFVPRHDDTVSEERLAQAKRKYEFTQCKKTTEALLGGLLHANPTMYLYRVKFAGPVPAEEVVVYIKSLLDGSSYLRYRFEIK